MPALRHIIVPALAALMIALAAPAAAQDPVDAGYGTPTEQTGGGGGEQRQGGLPLSGLDLGLIALGGALFLVAGIGLRRAARDS